MTAGTMGNTIRWACINRLKAQLERRDRAQGSNLAYPQAESDVAIALKELDYYVADASNLRVEKALVWKRVNREERLTSWRRRLSWCGVAALWAVAMLIAWRAL